jgi:quinol monooxygenase YgiN
MSEIVMAAYKAKPGKEIELEALIKSHVPTLLELGLITNRPALTIKSKDGTYIEIMEWVDVEASEKAHEHPAVAKIWEAMEMISQFRKISELDEAKTSFSHYEVVTSLSETFE